jgi:hypothetical protein
MADSILTPQVVAAVAGFGGVVVGSLISWGVQGRLLGRRIKADETLAERRFEYDKKLAERKFEFDKLLSAHKLEADTALAEKKFQLDTALADRKRRQDLAEEVLSSFYQMVDTIRAIRSPAGYVDEGKDRPKVPGESPDVAKSRDAYYAIVERFEARRKEIADLMTRRYRMTAWFGKKADEPFEIVYRALSTIIVSARQLIDWADQNWQKSTPDNVALWNKMRGDIWQGAATPDTIGDQVAHAIALIESICRPVLQEQVK